MFNIIQNHPTVAIQTVSISIIVGLKPGLFVWLSLVFIWSSDPIMVPYAVKG